MGFAIEADKRALPTNQINAVRPLANKEPGLIESICKESLGQYFTLFFHRSNFEIYRTEILNFEIKKNDHESLIDHRKNRTLVFVLYFLVT